MGNKIIIAVFMLCVFAWQTHAAVTCTAAGRFADPSDTTCKNYTLCVRQATTNTFLSYNYVCPTTSLFNPASAQCTAPTNYVCNVTATVNTTAANTSVCTADGFIADPSSTNCSSYLSCVQINGTFTQTTYTCPASTFFNPNTTLCETNYNCTIAVPFTCTRAGRFSDSTDTTCQNYHYCVLLTNNTFAQYNYTCPTSSRFNPTSALCTASYTCPST